LVKVVTVLVAQAEAVAVKVVVVLVLVETVAWLVVTVGLMEAVLAVLQAV
jgi:hypothetical protein